MTAGYAGKPLSRKFGITSGMIVMTVGAPDDYPDLLIQVPDDDLIVEAAERGATRAKISSAPADMVHLFTNSRYDLFRQLPALMKLIKQDGAIWVSWYKRAAKLPTEITEDIVRETCLPL